MRNNEFNSRGLMIDNGINGLRGSETALNSLQEDNFYGGHFQEQ